MKEFRARIVRCGCMMEWIRKGKVRVTPCSEICEAMMNRHPYRRGRIPVTLDIPPE